MINSFTYKQKLKALAIIAILGLLVCYRFAFSKTLDEYQSYKQHTLNTNKLTHQNNGFASLQYKEKKINEFFNQYILDTLQNEKKFLFICSEFCEANNLKIKEYIPYAIVSNNTFKTATKAITVEGAYRKIVSLLYYLETQSKTGRIVSSNFKSTVDGKDKKIKLNCTIYIQNLLFNNNEK